MQETSSLRFTWSVSLSLVSVDPTTGIFCLIRRPCSARNSFRCSNSWRIPSNWREDSEVVSDVRCHISIEKLLHVTGSIPCRLRDPELLLPMSTLGMLKQNGMIEVSCGQSTGLHLWKQWSSTRDRSRPTDRCLVSSKVSLIFESHAILTNLIHWIFIWTGWKRCRRYDWSTVGFTFFLVGFKSFGY